MKKILAFTFACFFTLSAYSQTILSSGGGLDPSDGTVLSSNHGFVNDDYNQWLESQKKKKAKQDAQVRASANLGEGGSLQTKPMMTGDEAFHHCYHLASNNTYQGYDNDKLQECMHMLGYSVKATSETAIPANSTMSESEENQMLEAAKYGAVEGAIQMRVIQYPNAQTQITNSTSSTLGSQSGNSNAQIINGNTIKSISINQTDQGVMHLK
jgi:hypothetical protein